MLFEFGSAAYSINESIAAKDESLVNYLQTCLDKREITPPELIPHLGDYMSSIARLRCNKRPGSDLIPNEFIKCLPFMWKYKLYKLA